MIVGKQLLEIITTGMYNDPKMLFREYIQNSADSIDDAISQGLIQEDENRINVNIDVRQRRIEIIDNGVGVQINDVQKKLCSIGFSEKVSNNNRGFRGIGRLGGLGYCDRLQFITKAAGDNKIAKITWDANKLNECTMDDSIEKIDHVVAVIQKIEYFDASPEEPDHFFKVIMHGVKIFHDDAIMSIKRIEDYLSQVAPVEYNQKKFSFANLIEKELNDIKKGPSYNIILNGDKILRPYQDTFFINTKNTDTISDLEFFTLKSDNGELLGKGWFALTELQSQIPNIHIRGIRVKQDNIEVGGESFLERFYIENRFSLWHIGEIHLTKKMRLNARRDDFEHDKYYEAFTEQMTFIGKRLSALCRRASRLRNLKKKLNLDISRLDSELSNTIFINENHLNGTVINLEAKLEKIKTNISNSDSFTQLINMLRKLQKKFDNLKLNATYLSNVLDARKHRYIDKSRMIEELCYAIHERFEKVNNSQELIKELISPYVKRL